MDVDKGINFAAREFADNMAAVINRSGLPHCIIRAELTALLDEVCRLEREQINKERQEYEAAEKEG